jgi:hypothetical protein
MEKKHDELIDELLEKIGNMLYQDNKYSEKEMAEMIVKLLEDKYDIK